MTTYIITGIVILIAGAIAGWKARKWKDELDHSIERVFEDALRNNE